MLTAYILASLLTTSVVLGRSSGPTSRQLTYTKEDQTIMQSDDTVQVMAVGDRSSNLKYVMAIQSSNIWEEIKKRSLTINTAQGLNEKSLDDLTDQELAQLKQACHDGLKCVAVDHLLVLKQVNEPLGDGKVSVRMAITKITQVITQYTTEYHSDVYQYEAVQQSDDQSKVYKSVTTIVEDNKELCQIDLTPTTEESHPKYGDDDTIPAAVDNNDTLINAIINIVPRSGDSVDGVRSEHETPPVDSNAHAATTDGPTGDESVTTTDDHPEYALQTTDDRRQSNTGYQPMSSGGPSPRFGDVSGNGSAAADIDTQNGGNGREHRRSRPDSTGRTDIANADEPATDDKLVLNQSNGNEASDHTKEEADVVNNNTVQLDNSSGCSQAGGENSSDSDIVSAGSHNNHSLKKGFVEDGFLNNGNMRVDVVDHSNRNKGIIKGAKANNGIINIGTTNNGPVNYGTSNAYTNNGTTLDMNSYDVNQYVNNINKMYSTILKEFAKK